MRHCGKEAIRIGRKIHARQLGLQIKYRPNERWILMRETIMLLSSPGGGFDVIDRAHVLSPVRFDGLEPRHRK